MDSVQALEADRIGKEAFAELDMANYIDMSEDSIVIGNTNKGIELPLWYTCLTLHVIVGIIHAEMPDLISGIILPSLESVSNAASTLLQKSIKTYDIK